MLKILMLIFQILSAKVLFFLEICKKKISQCKVLSPILKEICPIRIFLIKDFALFGGQVVRVVCKQIEHGLFINREQVLPYTIYIVHPINFIGFLILIEIVHFTDNIITTLPLPTCKPRIVPPYLKHEQSFLFWIF